MYVSDTFVELDKCTENSISRYSITFSLYPGLLICNRRLYVKILIEKCKIAYYNFISIVSYFISRFVSTYLFKKQS